MAHFTVERRGYTSTQVLAEALITDLQANGYTLKFPATMVPNTHKATFETSATVDAGTTAGSDSQPYRIQIDASQDTSRLRIILGTGIQLPDDGSISKLDDNYTVIGELGQWSIGVDAGAGSGTQSSAVSQAFIDRRNYDASQANAYPMSYRLSIFPHGIALAIWEPGDDEQLINHSWFVAQRSVNNTTGQFRTTANIANTKSPVWCMFSINRRGGPFGAGYTPNNTTVPMADFHITKRFIVRESDVLKPTFMVNAGNDSDDNNKLINIMQQVSITEDNNYVICFPNGLNTQRYAYPSDELDIIAYTSSDVIAQNSDVSLNMYGESGNRVYRAMIANGENNTKMRFLILTTPVAGTPLA